MAFPSELVKQRRDAIPERVRVVARVLWCRSIKCSYTGAGAGTTCVQVPSSEAVLAEGALSPRARQTSPEGGVKASSDADLARGDVEASSEAESARGSV
jgi:hypothetical protein